MPRTRAPVIYASALAYLAAGRSIVPIAPGCKAPSVVDPRTGWSRLIRWERYQHARATPAEVRRWFAGPQPIGGSTDRADEDGEPHGESRRAPHRFIRVAHEPRSQTSALNDPIIDTAGDSAKFLCFRRYRPHDIRGSGRRRTIRQAYQNWPKAINRPHSYRRSTDIPDGRLCQ